MIGWPPNRTKPRIAAITTASRRSTNHSPARRGRSARSMNSIVRVVDSRPDITLSPMVTSWAERAVGVALASRSRRLAKAVGLDRADASFLSDRKKYHERGHEEERARVGTSDRGVTTIGDSAVSQAVAGLTIGSDGAYTLDATNAAYQSLDTGESAIVTATYTVTDGDATDSATLTLTVTVNEFRRVGRG